MHKIFLAVPFITFCIFSAQAMSKKPVPESKKYSSTKNSKMPTGKSIGYFQMKIEKEVDSDNNIQLRARVLPRQSMTDAQFEWKVPKHVKISQGAVKGKLNLTQGQNTSFELTLNHETIKEKDQIFFFVYKSKDGERHGGSTSYIHGAIDAQERNMKKSSKKKIKYFE